jgi:hypothetical protein
LGNEPADELNMFVYFDHTMVQRQLKTKLINNLSTINGIGCAVIPKTEIGQSLNDAVRFIYCLSGRWQHLFPAL